MRHRFRTISAYFLIVVGLIMCPFPVIPGWPIVFAGLALLGPDHPISKKVRSWYHRGRVWLAKRGIGTAPASETGPGSGSASSL